MSEQEVIDPPTLVEPNPLDTAVDTLEIPPTPPDDGLDFEGAFNKLMEEETPEPDATPEPEPEPTPEPAPEPLVDEGEELPEVLKGDQKAGEAFKLIKAEKKEALQKIEELEKRLQETETSKVDSSELEGLKQVLTDTESKLAAYNVQETEVFQKEVKVPIDDIQDRATTIAKSYDIEPAGLLEAIAQSDPKRQRQIIADLAEDMNAVDEMSIYNMAAEYSKLLKRGDDLQSKAVEVLKESQAAQEQVKAREAEAQTQKYRQSQDKVWTLLESKAPFLKEDRFSEVKKQASSTNILEAGVEAQAFSVSSGLLLPHVLRENMDLSTKVTELESTLSRYTKADPGAGGGGPAPTPTSDPSDGDFLGAMERHLNS